MNSKLKSLFDNTKAIIKGKDEVIKLCLVAIICEGHLLLEDVPGVGKTTLAKALARSLDLSFRRIQFTSDLLPTDVTGVSVFNQKTSEFEFVKGPIFANIVLADEINRATPRTQSALLEVMNERQVTVDNFTYKLPRPFMVIATQNPIEYHGTFPLPESQLDRFLMKVSIGYPASKAELEILISHGESLDPDRLETVMHPPEIFEIQKQSRMVKTDPSIMEYIIAITAATRNIDGVMLGASPRASIFLHQAARAYAYIEGRDYCLPDDVKTMAVPVLSHRLILDRRYDQSLTPERIINRILNSVKTPI